MREISPIRRGAIALVSLTIAALLFRANIATAMVTRGDDLARAGNADRAIAFYRRALALDAGSPVAGDRLAFALVMRGASGDEPAAYRITDALLRTGPHDPSLLADRAFAAQRLRRWRDAERSFAEASRIARDPRYAHLAARMALRAHDPRAARRHLRDALALDPGYAPARAALRQSPG